MTQQQEAGKREFRRGWEMLPSKKKCVLGGNRRSEGGSSVFFRLSPLHKWVSSFPSWSILSQKNKHLHSAVFSKELQCVSHRFAAALGARNRRAHKAPASGHCSWSEWERAQCIYPVTGARGTPTVFVELQSTLFPGKICAFLCSSQPLLWLTSRALGCGLLWACLESKPSVCPCPH